MKLNERRRIKKEEKKRRRKKEKGPNEIHLILLLTIIEINIYSVFAAVAKTKTTHKKDTKNKEIRNKYKETKGKEARTKRKPEHTIWIHAYAYVLCI